MAGNFILLAFVAAAATSAPAKKVGVAATEAVRAPLQRSGIITNGDYPTSALRERAEGTSVLDLRIGADGRVAGCAITGSSGNAALDSTACSLAQRRFRFRPAVDAKGQNVIGRSSRSVQWRLPDKVPDLSGTTPASD